MKSMIDELWYGNVSPMDDTRNNTQEMKELMSLVGTDLNFNSSRFLLEWKRIQLKRNGILKSCIVGKILIYRQKAEQKPHLELLAVETTLSRST